MRNGLTPISPVGLKKRCMALSIMAVLYAAKMNGASREFWHKVAARRVLTFNLVLTRVMIIQNIICPKRFAQKPLGGFCFIRKRSGVTLNF